MTREAQRLLDAALPLWDTQQQHHRRRSLSLSLPPADCAELLPWCPVPATSAANYSLYRTIVARIAALARSAAHHEPLRLRHFAPLCAALERLGNYSDEALTAAPDDLTPALLQRLRPERVAARPRAASERLVPYVCATWWHQRAAAQAAWRRRTDAQRPERWAPFVAQQDARSALVVLVQCTSSSMSHAIVDGCDAASTAFVWALVAEEVHDAAEDAQLPFAELVRLQRTIDDARAAPPAIAAAATLARRDALLVAAVRCRVIADIMDAPALTRALGTAYTRELIAHWQLARAALLSLQSPQPLLPPFPALPPMLVARAPWQLSVLRQCNAWLASKALPGSDLYCEAIEHELEASTVDAALASNEAQQAWVTAEQRGLLEPGPAELPMRDALEIRRRCAAWARTQRVRSYPLPSHICQAQYDAVRRMYGQHLGLRDLARYGVHTLCTVHGGGASSGGRHAAPSSLKACAVSSATSALLEAALGPGVPVARAVPRRDSPIVRLQVDELPEDAVRRTNVWLTTIDSPLAPLRNGAFTEMPRTLGAWRATLVSTLTELVSASDDPYLQPSDSAVNDLGTQGLCINAETLEVRCDTGPRMYALPLDVGGPQHFALQHGSLPLAKLLNERLRARTARSRARAAPTAHTAPVDLRVSHAALLQALCYFPNGSSSSSSSSATPAAAALPPRLPQYADSTGELHTQPILETLQRIACRQTPLRRHTLLFHVWELDDESLYAAPAAVDSSNALPATAGGRRGAAAAAAAQSASASVPRRRLYAACPRCLAPTLYHPLRGDSLGFACGACVPVRDILQQQRRLNAASHCYACPARTIDYYDALRRPVGSGPRPPSERPVPLTHFVVYDDVHTHRLLVVGMCRAHCRTWIAQAGRIEPLSSVMRFVRNDLHARRLADGSGTVVLPGRTLSAVGTETAQARRDYNSDD